MFSHSVMYNSLRCHGRQQARRPRVCSKAVYSEYILFSHLHPCYPHPRYYHFLLGLLQQPPNCISSCPLSVYLQHISQRLCKPWLMMILYSHSSTLSHSTESKSHIFLKKKPAWSRLLEGHNHFSSLIFFWTLWLLQCPINQARFCYRVFALTITFPSNIQGSNMPLDYSLSSVGLFSNVNSLENEHSLALAIFLHSMYFQLIWHSYIQCLPWYQQHSI